MVVFCECWAEYEETPEQCIYCDNFQRVSSCCGANEIWETGLCSDCKEYGF